MPDPMRVISATVTRVTRSGQVSPGAPHDASGGAEVPYAVVGVPALRGEIEGLAGVGKLADFAVLDGNPLTIDPMKIADIR